MLQSMTFGRAVSEPERFPTLAPAYVVGKDEIAPHGVGAALASWRIQLAPVPVLRRFASLRGPQI